MKRAFNLRIIGRTTESSPWPRPKRDHEVRPLNDVEQAHHNLTPFFNKPVEPGLRAPMGTAKPLEGLGHFLSRIEEINAIAATQFSELPSLTQEFAANGLTAISLSSSADDDDLEAANLADLHLRKTPWAFGKKGEDAEGNPVYNNIEDLAALMARIEWERYVLACSSSTRIAIGRNAEGKTTLTCSNKTWKPDQITAYLPKIKSLLAGRSLDDIENDRARASFYGAVVAATMEPGAKRTFAYRLYTDCADDNQSRLAFSVDEEEPTGGPQEIGFHDPEQPTEPSEFDLWPLTDHEYWFGVQEFDSLLAQSQRDVMASSPY